MRTSPITIAGQDGLALPARYLAVLCIALSITMSSLDGTIVTLALPGIARETGSSAADSIWVVSAYQLAALTMLLPCAAAGDRLGYRKVYLGGVALFTLASALCFASRTLPMLVCARALQGAGAAGVMAINGAMVRLVYPHKEFGKGVALNSAIVAASAAAGPSVAAAVLSVASWPWLFAVNLPLGTLVFLLGLRMLPNNVPSAARGESSFVLDALLNAAMFGLVMLGLQWLGGDAEGRAAGSNPAVPLAMIAAGIAVGVVYVRAQRKLVHPLLPVDLLRIPLFRLSMCTSITSFAAQTMAYVALPFLLLGIWGRTAGTAGLLMSLWPLTVIGAAAVAGRLIGRLSGGVLGGVGLAALAVGLAMLAATSAHPSNAGIGLRMALCGFGFGLFQSPNNHTILTTAPRHRSGAAGGMLSTARLTGQTVGGAVLMLLFTLVPPHGGHGPVLALAVAAAFAAVASCFSFMRVRHVPALP